ncbi:MAG: helix-turn-helix domain-containing protein, partial [Phycisphaerae bacterium]
AVDGVQVHQQDGWHEAKCVACYWKNAEGVCQTRYAVRFETAAQVAKTLGVAERAVRNWVHRYNHAGLDGLRDRRGGRKCRLSAEQLAQLKTRLLAEPQPDDGVCSLRGEDMRRILEREFGTKYARSSVYYLLHRTLDLSYVTPRPLHAKTDLAAQETYKKTSRRRWAKSAKNTPPNASKSGSRTRPASGSKAR